MAATEQTLIVDEFEVFLKRSRRRSLSIEITPQGVQARAPLRMTQKEIKSFVRSKRTWLHKHLRNRPKVLVPLKLQQNCLLPYKGSNLVLNIEQNKRGKPQLLETTLKLPVQKTALALKDSVRNKVLKWYRSESLQYFENLVTELAPSMELDTAKVIKVRDYKRRWGSCDHKGDLSFNWRLIMAPECVSRYVVVHELAHRHEFNHSSRFWRIVERHQPDWREQRDWLYQYSPQLYRL